MSTESQNWRTEVTGGDYFLHQKKAQQLNDRKPVPRNAADIGLGPGMDATAVRLSNYNDLLATFNGYYSSLAGALNAPKSDEAFVGYVISDAELGGRQVFTGLTSGTEYTRTFVRNPIDPEVINWGAWSGYRVLPGMISHYAAYQPTLVNSGALTVLNAPVMIGVGDWQGVYERSLYGVKILKQGVYTGVVRVNGGVANNGTGGTGTTLVTCHLDLPFQNSTIRESRLDANPFQTTVFPFTAVATDGEQAFSVRLAQSSGANRTYYWTMDITRVGDAV